MATRRDLIEAQAFGRRRLICALLRGAAGVEPTEPGRTARCLGIGVALAVLLVVGDAVVDLFDLAWPRWRASR